MSTIRFELRSGENPANAAQIRLIYQIKKDRKALKTQQRVYPENWEQDDQRAIYPGRDKKTKKTIPAKKARMTRGEVEDINVKLSELVKQIKKIEDDFKRRELEYNVQTIADRFNAAESEKVVHSKATKELYAFIDEYIANHTETRVKGSLSVYRSLKAHLQGYEKKNGGSAISFEKLDHQFFQSFQNYLVGLKKKLKDQTTVRLLNNITIAKQLSTLKTFLNYAREDRNITVPDFKFKIKRETDLEVIALTEQEYQKIRDLDLSEKLSQDQVRDLFVFSCCTGLRYSDLAQLRWDHIKGDEIDLRAVKTGNRSHIPLNPDAMAILAKYKSKTNPMPVTCYKGKSAVISNQKANVALEKICKKAGIDSPVEIVRKYGNQRIAIVYPKYELVRMHCGRKTFASRMIALGMRAEIVMKIGGWKSWASFKRYMHIGDDTVKAEMTAIFSKDNKLKVV